MSVITPEGKEFLSRLSNPQFAEDFNIRGEKGGFFIVRRNSNVGETKKERDEAMNSASVVVAKFFAKADISGIQGVNTYVIRDNLVTLRERMLTNASSSKAKTSIESNMNRAIGALHPSLSDTVINALATLFGIILIGRRY